MAPGTLGVTKGRLLSRWRALVRPQCVSVEVCLSVRLWDASCIRPGARGKAVGLQTPVLPSRPESLGLLSWPCSRMQVCDRRGEGRVRRGWGLPGPLFPTCDMQTWGGGDTGLHGRVQDTAPWHCHLWTRPGRGLSFLGSSPPCVPGLTCRPSCGSRSLWWLIYREGQGVWTMLCFQCPPSPGG